jgi:hypothetical protein
MEYISLTYGYTIRIPAAEMFRHGQIIRMGITGIKIPVAAGMVGMAVRIYYQQRQPPEPHIVLTLRNGIYVYKSRR